MFRRKFCSFLAGLTPAVLSLSACAQSNVTLSGDFNLAVARLNGRTDSDHTFVTTKLDSVASHLRIRGTEVLDEGTSAILFLTIGARADTGTGAICGRECWVAIKGYFGMLKFGRLLTLYDDVSLPWYYIDAGGSHNPAALWANCGRGAGVSTGCLDDFVDNAIRYDAPINEGLMASVSFATPKPASSPISAKPRNFVAGLEHRNDNLYYGIALLKQSDVREFGSRDTALTASFKMTSGLINIGLGVENISYSVASGGSVRRNYVGFMLNKIVGQHTVWMNYGGAGSGYGDAAPGSEVNEIRNMKSSGARMESLGYQYKFSRTTQVYIFYNSIKNSANAEYCFDSSATNIIGEGTRLSVLAVGMRKRF